MDVVHLQENLRLLGKLNAIAESDSSKGTQSWTSKSYKSGYVYNPTTSQIHLDNVHIDRGPNAPCGGRSIYDKKKAECEIVEEVRKQQKIYKYVWVAPAYSINFAHSI